MTDIIRMAIECQLVTTGNRDGVYMEALERFAALVAAAEREALARVFETYQEVNSDIIPADHDIIWRANAIASVIRARGSNE